MHLLLRVVVFALFLTKSQQNSETNRLGRHLLDFGKMMKVFVRYNVKINVVPYTTIFAFATGFRGNWDVVPAKMLHSIQRISQKKDTTVEGSGNRYHGANYPATQYKRAIHNALQTGFDLHGLNGTACLQRTLCEVSLINHDDIISRIFKTVFKSTDEEFSCSGDLPCPFSFVDFVDHILTANVIVQT